jgi:hypothetical protein
MALLIVPSPLGRISGRIGDVVFRNCPDKTVVAIRPKSFTPGTDIASVNRRLRFKLTAMFSKCIKNIAPAYDLWSQHTNRKMSAYNLIFKNNYKAVFYDYISDFVQIFPKINFLIKPESISINKESFHINFLPEDSHLTGIDSPKYLQMAAIIFCKEPVDASDSKFKFINYLSSPVEIISNQNLSFDLSFVENSQIVMPSLNQHDAAAFARYKYHSVFVSFLALNSEQTFVQNSQTISLLNT